MADQVNIGVLMFVSHRAAESRVLEAIHRAGYTDLTMAQARIAARIGPNGTRISDLASQALVTKQTATALIDRLEENGYVERVTDPTDARARLVRLGPRGREIMPLARAEEAAIEAEWTHHLGGNRMASLRAALESLREITDPYQEQDGR